MYWTGVVLSEPRDSSGEMASCDLCDTGESWGCALSEAETD